jgi:hypothetical protein
MVNHFQGPNASLPATNGKVITASDTAFIEPVTRGVLVTVAGAVAVEYADGTQHVIGELAQGVMHPLQVRRILSTGTDATGISVFY